MKYYRSVLMTFLMCLMAVFSVEVKADSEQNILPVRLSNISISDDAYQNPSFVGNFSRGLVDRGVTDALLYAISDGIKTTNTQSELQTKNQKYFDNLRLSLTDALSADLTSEVRSLMEKNPMGVGLVKQDAVNQLKLNITEFGLISKYDTTESKEELAVYLKSESVIADSQGKELFSRKNTSYSNLVSSVQNYSENKEILKNAVQEVIKKLANQLVIDLYVVANKEKS